MPVAKIIAVAGLLLSVASPALAQRFPFQRVVAVDRGVVVDVGTTNGAVEISDGPEETVDISGMVTVRPFSMPANAVALAERVAAKPPVTATAGRVELRTPADADARRATTVSYRVRVPPSSVVSVRTTSGAVSVRAHPGWTTVVTQSGGLDLADVGETTLTTGSGNVQVRGVGALTVTTRSSSIDVERAGGALQVDTGSGRVRAAFVSPAAAEVRTRSSAITLVGASGPLQLESGSGQVEVSGTPTQDWQITTGSGRIVVTLARGASCRLEARSASGRIVAPAFGGADAERRRVLGAIGQGGPTLRLATRSASIEVKHD